MENSQLALIDSLQIPVYGTIAEPFVKCKDLLIHLLGYKQSADAMWYRKINEKESQMYIIKNHGMAPCFNELGIYWALMKSNKPIAQEFQFKVCELLKKMRQETHKQLEEAKKEIEELKAPKQASVYKIKQGDRLLYVGKDKSKMQNRPQQHLTARRKIAQGEQVIDIYLATLNEQDIIIEVQPCLDHEADYLERKLIEELQPEYNQAMTSKEYVCQQCDPIRIYKHRGRYQNHLTACHSQKNVA